MSTRLSRPSSATSHSSRFSHVSNASHSSRTSQSSEMTLECKAAYLTVLDDIHDQLTSKQDFILVLQQAGRNPTQKMVRKYWDDERDAMSFDEFVDVCRKEPPTSEDDLMKAFRKIDINGDGHISLDELYKIMTMKGEKMSRSEVKTMIDEVDENKDGKLDYREFCRMFISTAEECKKMSLKVMEKKERRKKRKEEGPTASLRKDKDEGSLSGSQLSIRSAASEKTKSDGKETEEKEDDEMDEKEEASIETPKGSLSSSSSRISVQSQRSQRIKSEQRDSEDTGNEEQSPEVVKEGSLSRSASKVSLRSQRSHTSERKLSQASLRSANPSGSRQSLLSIDDLPKPSPRGMKKSPVISRLPVPTKLQDWYHAKSKGCFFVDENTGFISHQYQLTLTEDTSIWLTIQPLKIGDTADRKLVDTAVYLLRDEDDDDDALITFTEQRDSRGCHGVRCDLTAGKYCLLPFTTGCRLGPRKSEPTREAKLVSSDRGDKITLTKPFKKALEEIFDIADLDGNGLLSREEFNWFNIRTSDDEVADDEWQVVEENVELESGQITKKGFIALNEMEAEDNKGETEDLWITLNNMGYNRALEMDEACPFLLDVYAEDGEAILKVTKLENPGKVLENAVCASAIAKGEAMKVKGMKDLTMYTYVGDARASIVIENKSRTKVAMELDCSKSRNCISSHGYLVFTANMPALSKKVGVHLLPEDERGEWSVRCAEVVLK